MKILVVDGNDQANNDRARTLGMTPYCEMYADILSTLHLDVETDIVHPSEEDNHVNPSHNSWLNHHDIMDYDGFVWTGSPMHLYENTEAVRNQRAFGEKLLKTGKPIFGSCWGLQINAELLGGAVRANPKGREIGMARNVLIADDALDHPLFHNKPRVFNALAIHLDEIETMPAGARCLASNMMSEVQAMSYEKNGVDFWGVQYHPEFDFKVVALIYRRIGDLLIEEGFCRHQADVNQLIDDYLALATHQSADKDQGPRDLTSHRPDLIFRYGVTGCITNLNCHRIELTNWLNHVGQSLAAS
ncbi:MAG: type 1 glutamine amidotransferase [Alphaproteobacteria bacterium]